jgi:glucose 1-dehydrogenase
MKAIVVRPGESGSIHMRDMPDPPMGPDEVAVKVLRVGLCGTDVEIHHGLFGEAPPGEEFLILGHENIGVVVDVGPNVKGLAPGDIVVSTVRRPCGVCPNCDAGEIDMCSSGKYEERGIIRRHGFMAEFYVESPRYLNKIPKAIEPVAVLLEPISVVEKAVDQAFLIQRRLRWLPKLGLVLGAGPVGLLAAAVLRARGMRTVIAGREPAGDLRARIAVDLGAEYVSVTTSTLLDLPKQIGDPDLIIEATGSAKVVFDAMEILAPNGVLSLLSLTGGSGTNLEPIERINQRLVLGNQVVFGSVNAHPRHFARGVDDFVTMEQNWPGVLNRLLTDRIPWQNYNTWFTQRGGGIKTVLDIHDRIANP